MFSDAAKENCVHFRQQSFPFSAFVPSLDFRRKLVEVRRPFVRQLYRMPVLVRPWFFDFYLVYLLIVSPLRDHRNREPTGAVCGFDTITIVPVSLHVLDAVEDDVFVAAPDKVKKTLPRYVT